MVFGLSVLLSAKLKNEIRRCLQQQNKGQSLSSVMLLKTIRGKREIEGRECRRGEEGKKEAKNLTLVATRVAVRC